MAKCVHPQVYITVLDENDNSPRFDFTSDSAISVPEDCPVGQRVATVKARDPDAGSNGQVGIEPGSTQAVGCFLFLRDHLRQQASSQQAGPGISMWEMWGHTPDSRAALPTSPGLGTCQAHTALVGLVPFLGVISFFQDPRRIES